MRFLRNPGSAGNHAAATDRATGGQDRYTYRRQIIIENVAHPALSRTEMFPGDDAQRQESESAKASRRSRQGTDRRALKHVAYAAVIIFGGLASLIAADVARVERRTTSATVVSLLDNQRKGCTTELATALGYARIYTNNSCLYVAWHLGDEAVVEARQLRFTRTIVIGTRGTIFEGARGLLPAF